MFLYKKVIFIFMATLLTSCGNYVNKKTQDEVIDANQQEKIASEFNSINNEIFAARCVTCHSQYSSYNGVIRELSAIQSAVASNRMPKNGSPLTDSQKKILELWISNGAPEVAGQIPPPPEPVVVKPNWKSISDNIIFPKCIACHNSQGQAKFLELTSRQIIFKNRNKLFADGSKLLDLNNPEKSYLVKILKDEDEPMPPIDSNIERLSEMDIEVIEQWIGLGLPEIGEE